MWRLVFRLSGLTLYTLPSQLLYSGHFTLIKSLGKKNFKRVLITNLLNKAGDVAARLFKPSSDGFIVKTTWRLFITCKQNKVSLKICLLSCGTLNSTTHLHDFKQRWRKKKRKNCVILLWLWALLRKFVERCKPRLKVSPKLLIRLIPFHFQFPNCCRFSEKELKIIHFKRTDSLHFFKTISLSDDLRRLSILGFHSRDETAILVYKTIAKCCSSFA